MTPPTMGSSPKPQLTEIDPFEASLVAVWGRSNPHFLQLLRARLAEDPSKSDLEGESGPELAVNLADAVLAGLRLKLEVLAAAEALASRPGSMTHMRQAQLVIELELALRAAADILTELGLHRLVEHRLQQETGR